MCIVPCEWKLHHGADGLLLVPQGGLYGNDEPKSRWSWLSDDVLNLSHDDFVGVRSIQSQQHAIPLDRRSYDCALRQLPYQ
jgi:hypothetical protein